MKTVFAILFIILGILGEVIFSLIIKDTFKKTKIKDFDTEDWVLLFFYAFLMVAVCFIVAVGIEIVVK